MRGRLTLGAILWCIVMAAGTAARAQEAIHYASLAGRVVDEHGGALAAIEVIVRQVETNIAQRTATDREGRFRFPYLRVGSYELTVEAGGFSTFTRTLALVAGGAVDLPVVLTVRPVETQVTVVGGESTIEAARTQIAGTVSRDEIAVTPLNGRQFLDLALLIPGVSPPNVGGGTQLFAETSAVPGVGLSIGTQRNLSNNFIVDGLSANDDAAGLGGMSFSVDAVDQFQVITAGGQAGLGRALGGYVNLVTRSGTNVFGGDLYTFVRDDRWNAANALSGSRVPMHQDQFGGSVGGPIVRDRTFFFGNLERRQLDQSGLVTIADANVTAINTRLAAVGYGGPAVSTGIYANPVDTVHGLAKLDHHFASGDHVSLRYSLYDARSRNSRGAGGTSAPSASSGLDNQDQALAIGNVFALTPRTVIETRAQFTYAGLQARPTDPVGPAVGIAGVASFGTLSTSPTGRVSRSIQIVNNLSHQIGAHALRAGLDVLHHDLTIEFPRAARGSYAFSSLANFLAGVYNNAGFTQTFGETVVSQTNPNVGVFLQDEWRVARGITVNAGVRYDLQYLDTIQTDTDNIAPRIGVAWSPFAAQHTILRASVGRFFDRIPLRALANALLSANNTTDLGQLRQISVSLSPGQTGAPVFPHTLDAVVPATTLVNLTTMDRNIENGYADQFSVEVQRRVGMWGRPASISAGYAHLRGRHLIMQINQNVPTCAVAGGNNGCRPNPAYANNGQYSSVGESEYTALQVSLVQQPSSWAGYRVSYTLSKGMNNVGETFFASPIDPADLSKDWGRSDNDRRHLVVATGTLTVPESPGAAPVRRALSGFQLSGVGQYYSALPFNITTGANTVQGTPARPAVDGAFIPRNAGQGSDFATVSLRVSRTVTVGHRVRVEGLVEAFNVFNRRNDVARNTVFGSGVYPGSPSPSYGQVTAVGDPRSIQIGVRVRY